MTGKPGQLGEDQPHSHKGQSWLGPWWSSGTVSMSTWINPGLGQWVKYSWVFKKAFIKIQTSIIKEPMAMALLPRRLWRPTAPAHSWSHWMDSWTTAPYKGWTCLRPPPLNSWGCWACTRKMDCRQQPSSCALPRQHLLLLEAGFGGDQPPV